MADDHPIFPPPVDRSCKIWRYMDFTKYVWLLQTKALFFSRADLLGDPFEGSFSKANQNLRPIVYNDLYNEFRDKGMEGQWNKVYEVVRLSSKWIYVSCWHRNDHESAAMWKLYAKTSEAIAIQTTYQRLFHCLPKNTYVGCVTYIDYEKDWLPEGNVFSPFMHKRMSFEHEHEVRALISESPKTLEKVDYLKRNPDVGRHVPVDLGDLIETVYVSPDCAPWFFQLVRDVSSRYDLTKPVIQSSINGTPFY